MVMLGPPGADVSIFVHDGVVRDTLELTHHHVDLLPFDSSLLAETVRRVDNLHRDGGVVLEEAELVVECVEYDVVDAICEHGIIEGNHFDNLPLEYYKEGREQGEGGM